jgi:Protein of unknown function (DUF2971)
VPVSQPDQYLYRFVSLAGERADQLRDVILTHRLFQPSPITFNDPFDCRAIASFDVPDSEWRAYFEALIKRGNLGGTDPSHEIDRMMLEKERQGAEFSAGMLRRIQADIDGAGVLCFSSDPTNILLWAHYANGHRGACLRFDAHSGIFEYAQEVCYSGSCKIFKATEVYNNAQEAMESAILTKAEGWRYEQEWRVFQPNQAGMFASFQPRELTAVILGCAASAEDHRRVRSWLAQRCEPLQLLAARRRSAESYELEMNPV